MKYVNYILIFILLFLIFSCENKTTLSMERGLYYYKNENYNEAMREFNNIIYEFKYYENLSQDNRTLLARAYYNIGLSYAKLNDFNEAAKNINEAIVLDPLEEYFQALELVK